MTAAEQIRAELIRAARGLGAPEDVDPLLERPRESSHGDWATNLAMVLAKPLKAQPREIAERIRDSMSLDRAGVSKSDSVIDYGLLEDAQREVLNEKAPRRT